MSNFLFHSIYQIFRDWCKAGVFKLYVQLKGQETLVIHLMDQTTTVGFVRNAVDQHFSMENKNTFLTYMDNKLHNDANMFGALEDLMVKKTSASTTLVLQSEIDPDLNFAGHSGKLWQCETCLEGFTVKVTFKKKHALGRRKSHKLLQIFKQPNTLGINRRAGWGKPDERELSKVKTSNEKSLKTNKSLREDPLSAKSSKKLDAGDYSGRLLFFIWLHI